jgi:hypothetical protein
MRFQHTAVGLKQYLRFSDCQLQCKSNFTSRARQEASQCENNAIVQKIDRGFLLVFKE